MNWKAFLSVFFALPAALIAVLAIIYIGSLFFGHMGGLIAALVVVWTVYAAMFGHFMNDGD